MGLPEGRGRMNKTPDLLVIGAGVVGLCTAISARKAAPGLSVVVAEREAREGQHASGRNSGVLHSGLVYAPGSLRAKLCREGNATWRAWATERQREIDCCGKVIVARGEGDLDMLSELERRAEANGVRVERVDRDGLREIEPLARTTGAALWSPDTAAFDPRDWMSELRKQALELGVQVHTNHPVWQRDGLKIRAGSNTYEPGHVLNAAGAWADRVARLWGADEGYRMLPYRGMYLVGEPQAPVIRRHIYPVPDLQMPFLGAHFTRTPDGRVLIGPSAHAALGRAHYGTFTGVTPAEWFRYAFDHLGLMWSDPRMRRHAARELRRSTRRSLVDDARGLVGALDPQHFRRWGHTGVRAQLIDVRRRALQLDFVIRPAERSTHVLNAISPAFTSAWAFARYLLREHLGIA